MRVKAQRISLPGRVFLWIGSIILIIGLVLPEANVAATAANSPSANGSSSVNAYTLKERDFVRIKKLYTRHKDKVDRMINGLQALGQNYSILRDRGNKNWVQMRVLCYDYNSYYQGAISHRYEVELLIKNHPGFNAKGKVTNQGMAKLTIVKMRGAVLQMITNIYRAEKTLKAGNHLMRENAMQDRGAKKNRK
jgi:hypothetical protein